MQRPQRLGGGLVGEPALLGLVEALDLAAGLGVVRPGVPNAHPEGDELELESDPAAAAGDTGEDGAVVGEHVGGDAPGGGGPAEGVDHVSGLERHSGVGADGKAGVVIDLVEDFDLGPVREGPVGDVELPAFIGLVGLEADIVSSWDACAARE